MMAGAGVPPLPRALRGLAALLVVYLIAPFAAVALPLARLDWSQLASAPIWRATWISLASATTATVLIAVTGIPLGFYLARRKSRASRLIGFVVQFPLALPPLTSGVLLLFLAGPYTWLGATLGRAGISLTDSFLGIVLAQTFVASPFLIIAARSAFAADGQALDDVAATLGHAPWSRFWRVSLPIAWPSICAGLLLAWLRGFGEFGATVMLAYHPYSLPVYTFVSFGSEGLAAMLPLLVPTLACALLVLAAANGMLRPRRALPAASAAEHLAADLDAAACAAHAAAQAVQAVQATQATQAKGRREHVPRPLTLAFSKVIDDFTLVVTLTSSARRIAILGSSGSGKSMTLRVLAGLDSARFGACSLGARQLVGVPAEQRQIAYVPQHYGLFPHLSVAQQVVFGRGADHAVASDWSRRLGIATLGQHRPDQLSLGQQQRVALVRALAMPSALLLLDEPFAALDVPLRARLRSLLRTLQHEIDATTIIVTHDPLDAILLADEIIVMHDGRILQQDATKLLIRRPGSLTIAALVGVDNVFAARVDAQGRPWLSGVDEPLAAGPLSFAAGDDYLLRVAPDAVALHPQGRHAGWIDDRIELGDAAQWSIRWGAATLRVAAPASTSASAAPATREACRFDIDSQGIDVWRPAPALA
jgi:molybdate transport system permease protein